jgi:chromosome segregation ATPase
MKNPTVIQNPIFINGKDENGKSYPNIDIRYGPYNSIEEAIDTITENNWLIPFLTIGILDNGVIKEYWVNESLQLTNKSLNTALIEDNDKKEINIVDYINKSIESLKKEFNSIYSESKNNELNIQNIIGKTSGFTNDIKNILNNIKNIENIINILKNNQTKDNEKLTKLFNDFKALNVYSIDDVDTKLLHIRNSIRNINKVLESFNEVKDDNTNNINILKDSNIKNEQIHANIFKLINALTNDIENIKLNINDVSVVANTIKQKCDNVLESNKEYSKLINNFNNTIKEINEKLNSSVCTIVKIDTPNIESSDTLTVLLQYANHYIIDIKNNDTVNTINFIINDNKTKYDSDIKITIYGNKNYNVVYNDIKFNKNIEPVIYKNSVTTITINSITKIATYIQIDN